MDFTKQQLQEIHRILSQHNAVAAYLFGSTARGTRGPKSDIDIAILFQKKMPAKKFLDVEGKILLSLEKLFGLEVDLVNLSTVTSPLLRHRAVRCGQLIYCTDHLARQQLERAVLQEYEDTRHLRAIQDRAMYRRIREGTFGKPGTL